MSVTIGIDPHKSTHTAVAVDREERTLARLTLPAAPGPTADTQNSTAPTLTGQSAGAKTRSAKSRTQPWLCFEQVVCESRRFE